MPDVGGYYLGWLSSKGVPDTAVSQIQAQVDALRDADGWIPSEAAGGHFDQKKKTMTVLHFLSVMTNEARVPLMVWASHGLASKDRKVIEGGVEAMQKRYGDGPAIGWATAVRPETQLRFNVLSDLMHDAWASSVSIIDTNDFSAKEFRRSISNWASR